MNETAPEKGRRRWRVLPLRRKRAPPSAVPPGPGGGAIRRLILIITRYPGWLIGLAVLSTLPAIYWTVQLYSNVRTDL